MTKSDARSGTRAEPTPDDRDENETGLSRRSFLYVTGGGLLAGAVGAEGSAEGGAPEPSGEHSGRVALITGGARGQGRFHAVELARRGADIVICDIAAPIASVHYPMATPEDLRETARQVEALGRHCLAVQADVRDPAAMTDLVAQTLQRFGRLDYLLANAGIMSMVPLQQLNDQTWDDVIQTNLYGVFHSIRAALPPMVERKFGRIVVTSSVAGRKGLANLTHYSASKWAVIGLVKSVALEVATQGITVNAVCPTSVPTDILLNEATYRRTFPDRENPTREDFIAYAKEHWTSLPQRVPWVECEDVTRLVLFLLSEGGRHLTGEALAIAAGAMASNVG
jgi:SDR family mycofactocin-dependent oxidoreductase